MGSLELHLTKEEIHRGPDVYFSARSTETEPLVHSVKEVVTFSSGFSPDGTSLF